MGGMEWMLEIALTVLLALTLFHALRLERALGVLKRDRAALADLVQGFNDATSQAEAGIERLRGAADGAGRQIARHVESAAALKDDLMFLTERGEKLADRMDALVRASRGIVERAPEPPRAASAPGFAPAFAAPAAVAPAMADTAEDEPRVRSQAERDLLKALRMAR
jgi:hypothetical protein